MEPQQIQGLVENLVKGERASFDLLFHLFSNRIYRLCRKMYLDHEEAEEVIQDVFLIIWERRELIDPEKDFKAYIFKIAKGNIIKNFRKKALSVAYERYAKSSMSFQDYSTEQLIHYRNILELLEEEIEKLPIERQKIFLLSRKEGLTTDEIAEKLNISKRTVENQIYRALKVLKSRINSFILFLL